MSDAAGTADSVRASVVWWLVFLVLQLAALLTALALDPAGFDPCGPEGSGPRPLQAAIAGGVVVTTLLYAMRRLRGWPLGTALVAVAVSAVAWIWLLGLSAASC